MAETRIYFTIRAQTTAAPTDVQWRAVLGDAIAQTGTLAKAIRDYARRHGDRAQNLLSAHKRSQNPSQLRRYTLAVFELDTDDTDEAIAFVNARAAERSITGNVQAKFEGVLQAEIREAARRQGFSLAQSNTITVQIVGIGARGLAKLAVQAYLAANAAIWYA